MLWTGPIFNRVFTSIERIDVEADVVFLHNESVWVVQ